MNAALLVVALLVGQAAPSSQVDDDTFLQQMISRKLPTPTTLEELTEQARRMRQLGADNAQIADYVSRVVDKRLLATNKPWGESLFLTEEAKIDRDNRWKPIDNFAKGQDGLPGKPLDDGRKYETLANLAWENKVGNCAESAAVSYTILKNAGIPVRILNSSMGGGHEFAVIGLAPNADPNDPSTWGTNAWVVDGWIGNSLTPSDARDSRWIFGGKVGAGAVVSDQTGAYDNPKAAEYLAELGNRGVVEVTVNDEKGKPVAGAVVTLHAQEAQQATTTTQGLARFRSYPGEVTVDAVPPEDSDCEKGQGSVRVESRRVIPLSIVLKESTETTVTITAPANGTETEASEITVTGKFKKLGGEALTIVLNGSENVPLVYDEGKLFQITLPIDMGKNEIQAVAGKASSAVVTVTRVDKAKSPWDGTWRGNYKNTIESTEGTNNINESSLILKITKIDAAIQIAFEHARKAGDGQPSAPIQHSVPLQDPMIAIKQTSEKFDTDEYFYGGQEVKTIYSLREGRLYVTSELVCTTYSRPNPSEPFKKSVTTAKGSGVLTRDP